MTLVKQIQQGGLTLLEIMMVVVLMTIMMLLAYPIVHHYILQTRLYEAQQLMLDNVMGLERHYARHFSYKQNVKNWVTLRHTKTQYFCIRMQGSPQSTKADKFTMKAVALNKDNEPRVLLINQDHRILVCDSSESSCAENKNFFQNPNRVDKNCTTI